MDCLDGQRIIISAIEHYTQLQNKFQKACSQVILLNNQIQNAQIRYNRASQKGCKPFMYVERVTLMTMEGVRNAFYEYAARLADVIDEEQQKLVAMGLMEAEYQPTS